MLRAFQRKCKTPMFFKIQNKTPNKKIQNNFILRKNLNFFKGHPAKIWFLDRRQNLQIKLYRKLADG